MSLIKRNAAVVGRKAGVTAPVVSGDPDYGWLYNWHVAAAGGMISGDWRIPTLAEMTGIITHLGGWEVAGEKLKSTRTEPANHPRWDAPNVANNSSGFTATPNGVRHRWNGFYNLGWQFSMWTRTQVGSIRGWSIAMVSGRKDVLAKQTVNRDGLGLRFLMDKGPFGSDGDTGTAQIWGHSYGWVVIGDYRILTQNIKTTHFGFGIEIPLYEDLEDFREAGVNGQMARCAYNNDSNWV